MLCIDGDTVFKTHLNSKKKFNSIFLSQISGYRTEDLSYELKLQEVCAVMSSINIRMLREFNAKFF